MQEGQILKLLGGRTSKKNVTVLTKYLLLFGEEDQKDYLGMILDKEISLQIILNDMKQKKKGYDVHIYDDIREKKEMEYIRDTQPSTVVEGVHKCYKCNNKKVSTYSAQLRSADEPMTHFYTCIECGNKWMG